MTARRGKKQELKTFCFISLFIGPIDCTTEFFHISKEMLF